MEQKCPHYQEAKCWKTGMTGPDVVCGGKCTECSILSDRKVEPTFGQLRDAYLEYVKNTTVVIRPNTVRNNIVAFDSLFRYTDLDLGQKISELDTDAWERYVVRAREDMSSMTIKSYGEKIHSLINDNSIRFYKSRYGWDCTCFPDLREPAKNEKWKSLPKETRRNIREYQLSLYDLADPRKYLCVTAAWERGQRKCDALRNHWSQITCCDGITSWDYTSVKNGKFSHWPCDPDTYHMLMVAKGKLSKMSVRRLGRHPDSYLRIREFTSKQCATSALWDECCDDLRRMFGWNGSKAMHNLRKDACDTIFQTYGIELAMEFSTDTEKCLTAHYVGKKKIPDDIVSIAKM